MTQKINSTLTHELERYIFPKFLPNYDCVANLDFHNDHELIIATRSSHGKDSDDYPLESIDCALYDNKHLASVVLAWNKLRGMDIMQEVVRWDAGWADPTLVEHYLHYGVPKLSEQYYKLFEKYPAAKTLYYRPLQIIEMNLLISAHYYEDQTFLEGNPGIFRDKLFKK